MKISFVIPAHNEEHYLGYCLDSIIAEQASSNADIEIIVVNNASTDHTREIAVGYPTVTVIDEPTKGLVPARQAGYLAAHGDVIANIDADTILPPGWIETVVYHFRREPRLIALSGPVIYYDLPRRIRWLVKIFYCLALILHWNNQLLRIGSVIQGGNFVIKRSVLHDLGGYNTKLSFYGEDADVARRLVRLGKVKFTLRFPMFASGRRLAAEGIVTMGLRYAANYFWIIFFKKPFSKTYRDIRPEQN